MNLQRPNANDALQTKNRSRNVVPQWGICSRCLDGCKGNCDLFNATFRAVNTESSFGVTEKVKLRIPVVTGALGSTDIARQNSKHFAIGAAITRISLVCGENVCGIDPLLELDKNGKIKESPEMACGSDFQKGPCRLNQGSDRGDRNSLHHGCVQRRSAGSH